MRRGAQHPSRGSRRVLSVGARAALVRVAQTLHRASPRQACNAAPERQGGLRGGRHTGHVFVLSMLSRIRSDAVCTSREPHSAFECHFGSLVAGRLALSDGGGCDLIGVPCAWLRAQCPADGSATLAMRGRPLEASGRDKGNLWVTAGTRADPDRPRPADRPSDRASIDRATDRRTDSHG